jgi:hypothetical protein
MFKHFTPKPDWRSLKTLTENVEQSLRHGEVEEEIAKGAPEGNHTFLPSQMKIGKPRRP